MTLRTADAIIDTWEGLGEDAWGRVLKYSLEYFKEGLEQGEKTVYDAVELLLQRFDRIVVIDVGCGSGEALIDLLAWGDAKGLNRRVRAVGVDVNEQIVPAGQDELTFIKADCTSPTFAQQIQGLRQAGEGVLATCLGNTLGIFRGEEREHILRSLGEAADTVIVVVANASAFGHALQHYYPVVAGDLGIQGEWATEGTTLKADNYYSHWTSPEEATGLFAAAGLQLRLLVETTRILVAMGQGKDSGTA